MHLPDWIKTKASGLHNTKALLRSHGVTTVCEEARCPNKGHCFLKPTATFMILGDNCTRNCGFCSVKSGKPSCVDAEEPERVAKAAYELGLKHVVITSVTRDDLPDGGALQFAKTIRAVKTRLPNAKVEVLTPDFKGDINSLKIVLDERPDVFNHNMETIKRLYSIVRPQADYECSINVLRNAKKIAPDIKTKSGLMLGLGETLDEVVELLRDIRSAGCDFLTVGQYLRPSKKNLSVVEYIRPEIFDEIKKRAIELGFEFVASGPLVRSSMNAEEFLKG
ncbi:lipoyl synthase [Dissulfurispira thermophila]|uniref:Lipoyl synthase n=2 Tax=root TaxID=1 RepID=A0A7G1H014_9BACT|nr:lipoyl synthase [Dissulfurispira thermophila]BCB95471.1 lipoyl synthase [Dissulfurispira thermophila]